MRQHEQALLFLKKAAEDEALLDAVLTVETVADATFGFHCQHLRPGVVLDQFGIHANDPQRERLRSRLQILRLLTHGAKAKCSRLKSKVVSAFSISPSAFPNTWRKS